MTKETAGQPAKPASVDAQGWVRSLVWPTAILVVFFMLYTPIHNILSALPNIVARANTISMGAFKIEIARQLQTKITENARTTIGKLSTEQIEYLLARGKIDEGTTVTITDNSKERAETERRIVLSLQVVGLVKQVTNVGPVQDKGERMFGFTFTSTELAKETRSALTALLVEAIKK